jgi:regulator of sigma E protease
LEKTRLRREAGLEEGDRIESINGREITDWSNMTEVIQDEGDTELTIVTSRDGEERTLELTPQVDKTEMPNDEVVERLIIGIGQDRGTWYTVSDLVGTGADV